MVVSNSYEITAILRTAARNENGNENVENV